MVSGECWIAVDLVHVVHAFCSHSGSPSSEDNHQPLRHERMAAGDLAIRTIFLLQTLFGILGNFSLLYHNLFLCCTGYRLKTIDLIVRNLIVANILVLFSSGVHNTMTNYGWRQLRSDFACRFFPYVRGVGRGVSIGTTCLLSVFQAITISPRTSRWAELKVKAVQLVFPSIVLSWVVNMLVSIIYSMYMTGDLSNENTTDRKSFGHCSSVRHDQTADSLYAALLSFPDVVCFVLMILASGSTVFILFRHKQRVQNIHRLNVSSISSPESKATKTVLLVVISFVYFNTLSSVCYAVLSILNNPSLFIMNISAITTSCFPALSPFLLMSRDSRISRLCFAGRRHASPPLTRKM